ncbi:MAG: UDP-N-acetylglucosamine 2-epimerase (non-hydrolyzing), partial [Flavobacteriaceae bacterium]|nr:UDP-N-acetylglucosamine 2-epimerase (non-hydrolyzing) [Flavobacteriaceae bacterium]
KNEIDNSNILGKLKLESGKYFLISCHREENVDNSKNFKLLIESLNQLAITYTIPIIFPIHPRTKKIYNKSKLKLDKLVKFIDPLGFNDYNKLQIESFVVLSDSGTIFEESSILNFRALNIRESHERPEAIEETTVIVTGLKIERILQGIKILENQTTGKMRNISLVSDYSIPNISLKIERIILSHIDFVNRVVWQKES